MNQPATTLARSNRFVWLALAALLAAIPAALYTQDRGARRDAWQRPQEVMDTLGVGPGTVVADVGAGGGYFTFHLAKRVGPSGRVYAVEIDNDELRKIRRRAERDEVSNVETVLGKTDDPRLPEEALDVVLIVNAFHEMRAYDAMLEGVHRALKPGGRLGIIEGAIEPGKKRSTYHRRHRLPEEVVREDAERNGFRLLRKGASFTRARDKKEFYFVIFQKPAP